MTKGTKITSAMRTSATRNQNRSFALSISETPILEFSFECFHKSYGNQISFKIASIKRSTGAFWFRQLGALLWAMRDGG